MSSSIVEGFSLSHAQILNGSQTFVNALGSYDTSGSYDIYGVNEASVEPNMDEYENEGDDTVLSTWSWLNYAEITVQAGYVSFDLMATMTGRAVTSSGAGDSQMFTTDLWHEDSMNVAPKPMIIVMPSKTVEGTVRRLVIGLYKVQFSPMTFDGPSYKDGLKINYEGKALLSSTDETGAAHSDGKKRVGKLLSLV